MSTRWLLSSCLAVVGLLGCHGSVFDTTPDTGGQGGGAAGGAGGQGGASGPEIPLLGSDCDPLVPTFCGLPFPSNVYLLDDASQPGGKSIHFGKTTLPDRKNDGARMPPEDFLDHDGFSPVSSPMTHLPGATAAGLATPFDIARSLDADSPTVLIEADTGARIPHWVDIDAAGSDDQRRMLIVRPAARLKDGTRYLVAIRDVVDASSTPVPPSKVFSALRDGTELAADDPDAYTVTARRPLYEDLFTKLDAAGVAKEDLQIAWDFTTASRDDVTGDLIAMRDLALADVGVEGPPFEIVAVEEFPTVADHPLLRRRIEVKMTVPLYLTSAETSFSPSTPLAFLNKGADGKLAKNGTMDLNVLILVPRSVEQNVPHGLLQNGHGLFGSKEEGRNGYFAKATDRDHYIGFAVDFFGFDSDAEGFAPSVLLGREHGMRSFTERQLQGMVNQLLAMRMMMGRVAADGIVDQDGNVLLDAAWIDPSLRAYRGDSQGGIMGATYMAVSTDVTRGLLGEPGQTYSLLLNRSLDWPTYENILKLGFGDDPLELQLILSLLQLHWDRVEPSGFAAFIEKDMLPNTPKHSVILSVARGDHQVTTFSAHALARSIGAGQLASDDPNQPFFTDIFGLPTLTAPQAEHSVLVEYDFGLAENPANNTPNAAGCDPHDRVRQLEPAFEQQDVFFRTGSIEWTCDGACNCDDTGMTPGSEQMCPESFIDQCQ